jgi:cbb3-type cytochrome oxidase subunit 1
VPLCKDSSNKFGTICTKPPIEETIKMPNITNAEIAFWAFIYTYIWVGPHHLHYTSIPDWLMTVAMVMRIILILHSWATMMSHKIERRQTKQTINTTQNTINIINKAKFVFTEPLHI